VQPLCADTGEFQKIAGKAYFLVGLNITFQVMAVTKMSPGHQYPVSTPLQGFDNKHRVHPAGAHHPDGSDGRGVLETRHTGQVGTGIGAPVAKEGHDFRFKGCHRFSLLFCGWPLANRFHVAVEVSQPAAETTAMICWSRK
jgi:hypothetical protein